MIRSIVIVALIVVLVVGCFFIYKRVNGDNNFGNGDVLVRNSSPDRDQMETGTTFIGDKPVTEAHPTPSRSDAPGTIITEPVADYGRNTGSSGDTTQYGPQPYGPKPYSPQSYGPQPYSPAAPYRPQPQPYSSNPYTPTPLPSNDTLTPNAPNGLAFAGTGTYEWYRQGDLTWRIDTKTGASCVDYATLEEWRKPLVYSHGCGTRGWRRRGYPDRDQAQR